AAQEHRRREAAASRRGTAQVADHAAHPRQRRRDPPARRALARAPRRDPGRPPQDPALTRSRHEAPMETRPAPLDGMNHDDGLDEFRVSSPREIQTLLRQLVDGSVLLNLNASDGSVFTSAIWTIDSTRGTIGFNADPADPAMQALLQNDEVTVVGYLDSVKLQFDIQDLVLVHGHKASVLPCPAPLTMYRFQRREAFR